MKMKNSFLKCIALSMALLLFATSAGLAMDLHYCGGEYQNFGLYSIAKSCHDKAVEKKSCHHSKSDKKVEKEASKDCCSNESYFFQLDEDFTTSAKIDKEDKRPIQLAPLSDVNYCLSKEIYDVSDYKNYKPPLIVTEAIIDFQSFLI